MTQWNLECDRLLLDRAIVQWDKNFDPDFDLLSSKVYGVVYHSTLRSGVVHPIREAFYYSAGLLDHGGDAEKNRAIRVLKKVLQAQDTNPNSRTYGIWPWFWEEPLDKMSPPDWNWADFCGEALYLIIRRHWERLPDDMQIAVKGALIHATRSIKRRNVGPGYTNIAILGTFVTLATAEWLGDSDLLDYAKQRLIRLDQHIDETGTLTEFNSPTYTTVSICALTRSLQFWQDESSKYIVRKIHDKAWLHVGMHWHAHTMQWAGPHSRCYSTDLRNNSHAQLMIQKATQGQIAFYDNNSMPGNWEASLTDYRCPENILPMLLELTEERQHRELFQLGRKSGETTISPVVGTTYLSPKYTLGTCNRLDLWNQRRSLLAYWGDRNSGNYLHLRCFHDGYDFSSAQFFSVQEKNCVIGAANFGYDGGDQHISLDRIQNRQFKAHDIRLRWMIAGVSKGIEKVCEFHIGKPFSLDLGSARLNLYVLTASFGQYKTYTEINRNNEALWLDVVLYNGEEKILDWNDISNAFVGFALWFGDSEVIMPIMRENDSQVTLQWQSPTGDLALRCAKNVRSVGEQQSVANFLINGKEMPSPRLGE